MNAEGAPGRMEGAGRADGSVAFTPRERALFGDREVFAVKARLGEKIRAALQVLHERLREECRLVTLAAPEGFDPDKFQLVRGEHLEHHPYQYLDYPKHFQDGCTFTFRTLVWWGHHVVCAWLLEGARLELYKRHVLSRYQELAGRGIELGIAPGLWEWKVGEGYTLPLKPANRSQVAAVLERRPCMKLCCVIPPDDPALAEGRLPQLGLEAFRALLPIVRSSETL